MQHPNEVAARKHCSWLFWMVAVLSDDGSTWKSETLNGWIKLHKVLDAISMIYLRPQPFLKETNHSITPSDSVATFAAVRGR